MNVYILYLLGRNTNTQIYIYIYILCEYVCIVYVIRITQFILNWIHTYASVIGEFILWKNVVH